MDTFLSNPGLNHIGLKILFHLDFETLLNIRLVSQSWKWFLDNPRFWLKFLRFHGKIIDEQITELWTELLNKIGNCHHRTFVTSSSSFRKIDKIKRSLTLILMKEYNTSEMLNSPFLTVLNYRDIHLLCFMFNHIDFLIFENEVLKQPPQTKNSYGIDKMYLLMLDLSLLNTKTEIELIASNRSPKYLKIFRKYSQNFWVLKNLRNALMNNSKLTLAEIVDLSNAGW